MCWGGGGELFVCFVLLVFWFVVCCFPALRSKQEKGTDRQTDRQTDTDTDRQTDRKSPL